MTRVSDPSPELLFGSVDLMGDGIDYSLHAGGTADNTSLGSPVPITQTLDSYLQDGSLVATTGYDNRDGMVITVRIKGQTADGLAAGEAALNAEVNAANSVGSTLSWTPPGGYAKACVFDIVAAELDHTFIDTDENNLTRTYVLTLTALPFARAADLVSFALPAPSWDAPSIVSVDDCSATTGWSATGADSAPVLAEGGVSASVGGSTGTPFALALLRTGLSVSTTGKPFVRLELAYSADSIVGVLAAPRVLLNGVQADPVAVNSDYAWYAFAGPTLESVHVEIDGTFTRGYVPGGASLTVRDISLSDQTRNVATPLQQGATVQLQGSARSQGSLFLDAGDDAGTEVGDVIVYTTTDLNAMQPPCSPYLDTEVTTGTTATDVTAVSGQATTLSPGEAVTYTIPATAITPGPYLVLARVRAGASDSNIRVLTWGADVVDPDHPSGQISAEGDDWPNWMVVVLGIVTLPRVLRGPAGTVQIYLNNSSVSGGGHNILVDEVWLFNMVTGRLSLRMTDDIAFFAPVPWETPSRVWLDAPSAGVPVPRVWFGTVADRSDAWCAANIDAIGNHELVPPSVNLFVVTSGIPVQVSGSYYPRFHTHVH